MIRNYMEHLVNFYFADVLESSGKFDNVCRCEKCADDIRARALNELRPYYVTSKRGEIFAEYANLQSQYKADVFGALARAITFVSERRNCEGVGYE